MQSLRHLLASNRSIAVLILAAALVLRVLVPPGFMPMVEQGRISIVICPDGGPQTAQGASPAMAHGPMTHGERKAPEDEHGKAEPSCVFTGLAAPALAGTDPLLRAAAILFILLLAVRTPERVPVRLALRLRPPLRGPPLAC